LLLKYTIPLDPKTKKNHQRIVGMGTRCPFCGKPKKQIIAQGKAHVQYMADAFPYIMPKPEEPLNTPLHIKYLFYMHTRRKVDTLNLQACADDLLVEAKVIADDNSNIVKSHDGTRVFYDKENPRTEIYITDYREEDENEHEQDLHCG
jgi:Holliday junction resolvase RusA-like endonuclease